MIEDTIHVPFNVMDWDPIEIARQMTLIDFSLFKNIHHKECFGKGQWDAEQREVKLVDEFGILKNKQNK